MSDPTPPPSAPKKRRPAARKRKPAKKVAPTVPVEGANAATPMAADGATAAVPAPSDAAQATVPAPADHPGAETEALQEHKAPSRGDRAPAPASRRSDARPPQQKAPRRPAAPESVAQPRVPSPPVAPASPPAPIELIRVPLSVRWRDLDAFNHVNNSKYLSYLEEARLRWMMTMPGMGLDDDVAPVVAASNLNYRRPISWPGEVLVELFVERIGNTSVTVGHRILDAADSGVVYCDGNVVMVWIDRQSGRAAPLPESVRLSCSNAARNGG